jgi:hypothetical protein
MALWLLLLPLALWAKCGWGCVPAAALVSLALLTIEVRVPRLCAGSALAAQALRQGAPPGRSAPAGAAARALPQHTPAARREIPLLPLRDGVPHQ